MIWVYILLVTYLLSVAINAWWTFYTDKSHMIWQIAFQMWKDSLNKKGYPRHESGAWMTYWELVDYFNNSAEKDIYTDHVKRNWQTVKPKKP